MRNRFHMSTYESCKSLLKEKGVNRGYLCPADQRIQAYLDDLFSELKSKVSPKLPDSTLMLDEKELARSLSLPLDGDYFSSDIIKSYRVKQGVLHNPKEDRRTTKGVFHIAEGGILVPDDKIQVPLIAFGRMLIEAFSPPDSLMTLPLTQSFDEPEQLLLSLYLRPMVCPEVPGYIKKKSSEIRFFAPGNLVSNLDFVESIFGNAGNPYDFENDAGLDIEHWTGHTGCVVLAPQLIKLKKKDLGLPHYDFATERQRRDGVCWRDEGELYNDGKAFKITSRDQRGVMVTLIADNYYGYCKKEVKTQIGFSANLYGLCEEEHAGGAAVFASYNLGAETHPDNTLPWNPVPYENMIKKFEGTMNIQSEGYAIDEKYSDIIYVPENSEFSLKTQTIKWVCNGKEHQIKLLKDHVYLLPSGYKIQMEKLSSGSGWRLLGTIAPGTVCHKPCTVSGGGKSEISKSLSDAIIQGPVFTANLQKDLEKIEEILNYDFSKRFKGESANSTDTRPVLSQERSLGSVIKLLTPSADYTYEYNTWVDSIEHNIKIIIYELKRAYKPEWGNNWRNHLSVDVINNYPGHELKIEGVKLTAHYLRVGHQTDGSWRIFKLRSDFCPADKVQTEDDISASIVVPREKLEFLDREQAQNPCVKLLSNCESKLFQRPDDAIYRGYDKQTESDLSQPNTFLSNYEPLSHEDARLILEEAIGFDKYTPPVKKFLRDFENKGSNTYFVLPSHPRLVNGKPTKNPRYLQIRPDLVDPRQKYIAEMGERLWRQAPMNKPLHTPVHAVIAGRRCNPAIPEQNVPALAVYSPIHYQELPELFMDFICSVTGKSPSTTGFGSEGALTKGPFNALPTTADLNNALLSFVLTGYHGFSSTAGYVGPNVRVDHDVSLLIPEIWCRMRIPEREPEFLIKNGYLEKIEDFEHEGKTVRASRLGYRITRSFLNIFLGRIFSHPNTVFTEEMLKPELQDMQIFVEGVNNLVETQKIVANHYMNDKSVEMACPPIKALINIMATGSYNGKTIEDKEVRSLFDREAILKSDWYLERLNLKQKKDIALWKKHCHYIESCRNNAQNKDKIYQEILTSRLKSSQDELKRVSAKEYPQSLIGTLGIDPLSS